MALFNQLANDYGHHMIARNSQRFLLIILGLVNTLFYVQAMPIKETFYMYVSWNNRLHSTV